MNKTAIKNFAIWARVNLIESAKQKAFEYEVTEDGQNNSSLDIIAGRVLSNTEKKQRAQLITEIKNKGFNQVMEEAAYTWFNRFIALRYMEVNGFLPSKVRVFSDEEGKFNPAILSEAMSVELDGLDREKVLKLLDKQDNEALYKMLIISQCNALSSGLPYMFEKIENWTELLFPSNLLKTDSVVGQMVTEIPEEDWKDAVQIIGWMYQYYNSELKDETFALLKKNVKITKERIPAATQLFTPDWIVRYMVENSLGRFWVEGHPNDELKKEWKYYLEEADQEPQVREELERIRKEYQTIKPEEIKVIDPCMGSGHILVYAFDVLMQIYTSAGWAEREAAKSIVENNIFGLDIDDRAGQLAYFAVMMKARKYNRRILSGDVIPNIMAIQDSSEIDSELIKFIANGNMKMQKELIDIKSVLADAKEYGSILAVLECDFESIKQRIEDVREMDMSDIITGIHIQNAVNVLLPIVKQSQIMAQKYDIIITNPPYMGAGGMSGKLSEYVKSKYPDSKSDMYAIFIEKCGEMLKKNAYQAMITQHSWMFLSSFETLRQNMMRKDIVSMAHLGPRAFEEIGGEVVQTTAFVIGNRKVKLYKGTYTRLVEPTTQQGKEDLFLKTVANHDCRFYFTANSENFSVIPGAPVAYWLTDKDIKHMSNDKKVADLGESKQGLITSDNERFLRLWFEVEQEKIRKKWFYYNKGGGYRKWYGLNYYVVNWENEGHDIKAFVDDKGKQKSRPQNTQFYFCEGISWCDISTNIFSVRYVSSDFMFDASGPTLFVNEKEYIKYLCGLLNTNVAQRYLDVICQGLHYSTGHIPQIPVVISESEKKCVDCLVEHNIEICKDDWDSFEISWDFMKHPLIGYRDKCESVGVMYNDTSISNSFEIWKLITEKRFKVLKANEEELNRIFINIYGFYEELKPEVEEKDVTVRNADLQRDIKSFISYAVGCMTGRYSLDVEGLVYAGGTWDTSKYTSFLPNEDNIIPICDDEYFSDDIVGRFVEFVKVVYGEETLEENLKFIADTLGGKGTPREVIRTYFLKDFFNDHCKTYQKRPIYWLFDSGKKDGIKCLVYMHRYQSDTVARIRTDYIHEMQSRYATAIEDLERNIQSAEAKDRIKMNKKLAHLKEQEIELRTYEEKIHLIADQMIDIDLDDGVKVNYAKFGDVLAKIK
ncbi:MAG: BREX-1 system adenine-specific DNA-methyltransferase PglX [Lachnospiraceae bacterium]|nr:BREX-1 system adenine-specific DNA-methyltransferase PglX [Lachnospiraceae bacterium]